MKILVVHRASWLTGHYGSWLRALEKELQIKTRAVGRELPRSANDLPELDGVDACIWMVAFRDLHLLEAFDWSRWGGLRVLYDHDAMNNYSTWGNTQYRGAWNMAFSRHQFQLLVVNDNPTAMRFRQDGIPTAVVWKGFDGDVFRPLGLERSGLGTFGVQYPSRRAAQIALRRRRLSAEWFRMPFAELNPRLNTYEAVLVTNSSGRSRRGATVLNWLHPGLGLRDSCGAPTVLAKSFEVAGSGAVLVCDRSPELDEMGFIHGETALVYDRPESLPKIWREWRERHEALRTIGEAGSAVAHSRHTWRHRARALGETLEHFAG